MSTHWSFAKETYETLKNGPHEPAARAYLEATARLVLLSVAAQRQAANSG